MGSWWIWLCLVGGVDCLARIESVEKTGAYFLYQPSRLQFLVFYVYLGANMPPGLLIMPIPLLRRYHTVLISPLYFS